jgi:hypothetical protein
MFEQEVPFSGSLWGPHPPSKTMVKQDTAKRIPIVKSNWDYEVTPAPVGNYGYTLAIYKNGYQVFKQSGFGAESSAAVAARDYVLGKEFGIEQEDQE